MCDNLDYSLQAKQAQSQNGSCAEKGKRPVHGSWFYESTELLLCQMQKSDIFTCLDLVRSIC